MSKDIKNDIQSFFKGKQDIKEEPSPSTQSTLPASALDQIDQTIKESDEYEGRGLEAAALGAARGLTFGLSDQALTKLGRLTGYTSEELKNIKEYNQLASTAGEVGGIVVPSILSGGSGAAGTAARGLGTGIRGADKAGKLAENAFAKILAEQGKKSVAKNIVAKTIPKVMGSGVEGAIYGTGQLISENALGTADFNGENIIAAVGTGALLGGAARGIFEAPKLLAPVAKKLGSPLSKKASEFFDRPGAALDLIGTDPKKARKLIKFRPDFVEELPDWLAKKAKLKPFTKTQKLTTSVEKIKDEAAESLSSISKQIDDIVAANADQVPPASMAYLDIYKTIDNIEQSKLIKDIGLSKLKKIKKSALSLAKSKADDNATASAIELRNFKREIDDIIPYGTETSKMEVAELKKLRGLVDDKVKELASIADNFTNTNLKKAYEQANKDYSYSSIILPNLDDKLAKEAASEFPRFKEVVLGGVAHIALGAPAAAAGIGLKKFAESDLRRRMIILSGIEKSNRQINQKLSKGINSFFEKTSKVTPKLAPALMESSYSLGEKNEAPKNRQQAFNNVSKKITELVANPEKVEKIVTRRTLHLNPIAPNSTNYAMQTALKGLEFLNSKLPKQASSSASANRFAKRPYTPSELEMSKFERYLQAVEDPMSTIDQLESGTLTREAAEAVQVVYPRIFAKMQEQVIEKLESSENPVPYSKRLQLGILLNIETDMSLSNTNIASLQQNLLPQQPQVPGGPTAARADKIEIADRYETQQNRISQK